MDLAIAKGIERDTAQTFTDFLSAFLSESPRFLVVSKRDIARLADLEADKQQQGCENSDACMAEIAGALGARFVVFGRMSKLGPSTFIHLTLVDSAAGQPLARKVISAASLDELATLLRTACTELADAAVAAGRGAPVKPGQPVFLEGAKPRVAEEKKPRKEEDAGPSRVIGVKSGALAGAADDDDDERRLRISEAKAKMDRAAVVVGDARRRELKQERAAKLSQEAFTKRALGFAVIGTGSVVGVGMLGAGLVSSSQPVALAGVIGCCAIGGGSIVYGASQLIESAELEEKAATEMRGSFRAEDRVQRY